MITIRTGSRLLVVLGLLSVCLLQPAFGQANKIVWSADEKPLAEQIHGLRSLSDDVRAEITKDLAIKIRQLPATENKRRLAMWLASLSTEGDFGHATLQEVATTLAETLKERPVPWPTQKSPGAADGKANSAGEGARATQVEPADEYVELASLVRYEHVEVSLDSDQYRAAMARLQADDRKREHAEFSLKDLNGKTWTFSDLRGKVVLVNFWATWCPPCRKEMPDLEALYQRFGPQGLVILGISDEEASKVEPFIRERKVTFPILLDPGRKVNEMFIVEGIPKSFVYDRDGKLVSQSIDMRTRGQFLEMLAKAGIQ
ncbi:MAG: TlpA disulfide reductase family protein [Terriglobales bacterium]